MSKITQDSSTMTPNPMISGASIALGAIISIVLMSYHPSISAGTTSGALEELANEAFVSKIVHGGMITVLGVQTFGFAGFSARLGLYKSLPLAGFVAYVMGTMAMVGAAIPSGFLFPDLAIGYLDNPIGDLESLRTAFFMYSSINQTLAQFGVIASSVAIFFWSLSLLQKSGVTRVIGILGVPVAAAPAIAILFGFLVLTVHGMALVVMVQASWSVAVGVQLWRRKI